VGAVRSSGEGGADEPVSIDAVDDNIAIKGCAAALVEELQVEPSVALRFARARKGDFRRAKPFLQADLAWRAQKTPVTQDDCPTPLASGAWRMLGCTSAGQPVVFVHTGLWKPAKYGLDEYERFIIYFFESMLRMGGGVDFVMIFDVHGWTLSHVAHMRKLARLISTLQDKPCNLNP
jgi:hypothetical protein